MINRGGEKIYSLEVENLIFNYPKVLEVAVVGVPDSVLGEAVKAVIVLKQGENETEEEIKEFCAKQLADYKVPKFVEFMDGLPRNPAGKVRKADLRYDRAKRQEILSPSCGIEKAGVRGYKEKDVIMEEKIALVTGSSRGIGRAIALGLAKEGVRVVVHYQSRRDAAEEVARAIIRAGGSAIVMKADVANDAEVKSMVDQVAGKWGTVDILVNNAATHRGGRIQKLTLEDWDLVINSALGGAFRCCRHIVPMMVQKKNWGRIINLSSYVALHGFPGDTPYGAAKAGLLGLTLSLAKEVAAKGITVNAVIPGYVPTDMTRALFDTQEKIDRQIQEIPIHRPGKAEEIADMVNFLVFKGEYITGTVIRVDGGLAM